MANNPDWTGNKATTWAVLGASNHALGERQPHDYYATDPRAIPLLLEQESFGKVIIEPACGEGHLSKALIEAGYTVHSADLIDRGYGAVQDFFEVNVPFAPGVDIITNPPYSKAAEFAEHALDLLADGQKLALFLKIQFLESEKRRRLFKKYPPRTVYVFTHRILCAKNGRFEDFTSSATCYAWFVWVKGFRGDPVIKWIN